MLTKPCARVIVGCSGVVEAPGPRTLAKRQFCCLSCAIRARIEAGWRPHANMTLETRQRGGHRGGLAAGIRRRKKATLAIVADMRKFLKPDVTDGLSPDQLRRVLALMARAYRRGYRRGYHAGFASSPSRRRAA